MVEDRVVWVNGDVIPWEKATVHIMSHSFGRGSAISVSASVAHERIRPAVNATGIVLQNLPEGLVAAVSLLAPEDGRYVIEVRESSYGGSSACKYRLHVGRFPRPLAVFPVNNKPAEPSPRVLKLCRRFSVAEKEILPGLSAGSSSGFFVPLPGLRGFIE